MDDLLEARKHPEHPQIPSRICLPRSPRQQLNIDNSWRLAAIEPFFDSGLSVSRGGWSDCHVVMEEFHAKVLMNQGQVCRETEKESVKEKALA
jgi:hypothetical protein